MYTTLDQLSFLTAYGNWKVSKFEPRISSQSGLFAGHENGEIYDVDPGRCEEL